MDQAWVHDQQGSQLDSAAHTNRCDSPEDQDPGKGREVEEMTNEKGGIMTDLASSRQEEPNPEWN